MKRFRLQCILRVLFLGATFLVAAYLFQIGAYAATGVALAAGGFQLYSLVRYVTWTNRELNRFLRSVRYGDFSQRFTGRGRGASFDKLGSAFTEVMEDFRQARAEKEAQYRYLQTVMQHVGVGLISFQEDGAVSFINSAAKRLLSIDRLRYVDHLRARSDVLVDTLLRTPSGENALVKLRDGDELLQLSIYVTAFKLRDRHYRLASLQNIQRELEEKEVEAWQKLTRVLTHEIMNSITPVASLASTANDLLADPSLGDGAKAEDPRSETIRDVRDAMRTIERRSQSLLHFVDAYRRLTRIPQPDFQIVVAQELFDDITKLLAPELERKGTRFTARLDPESLTLTADPDLVEQVLINLVKNAAEAVEGQPDAEVILKGFVDSRSRPVIQVIDNGPGIVEEALDKIFVPFFTTKKDGSGIGLSLSREIMRQHGGTISATSEPDERTAFTLRF